MIEQDEKSPVQKIKKVEWTKLKLIDMPFGTNFDFNNKYSLWYHQLDYEFFLR